MFARPPPPPSRGHHSKVYIRLHFRISRPPPITSSFDNIDAHVDTVTGLPKAVHAVHGLQVLLRVPVVLEEDDCVRAGEVQAESGMRVRMRAGVPALRRGVHKWPAHVRASKSVTTGGGRTLIEPPGHRVAGDEAKVTLATAMDRHRLLACPTPAYNIPASSSGEKHDWNAAIFVEPLDDAAAIGWSDAAIKPQVAGRGV